VLETPAAPVDPDKSDPDGLDCPSRSQRSPACPFHPCAEAIAVAAGGGVTVAGAPPLPEAGGCAGAFCCRLAMRPDRLPFEPELVVLFAAAHPSTFASVNRNATPDGTGSGTRD
jgi:hypothetical protein